jgi:hypothetical protein
VRPTFAAGAVCALAAALSLALAPPAAAASLRARLHAALAGFDGRGTGALVELAKTARRLRKA